MKTIVGRSLAWSRFVALCAFVAPSAGAQSSLAACALVRDSTARQAIVVDGSLKVCLLVLRPHLADSTPREWASRGDVVILETQEPDGFRRFALDRKWSWTINGKPAPVDSLTTLWQRGVVDVVEAAHAADRLRAMADGLRATDVVLPSNPDSAKAERASIEKRLALIRSKITAVQNLDRSLTAQIAAAATQSDLAQRRALEEQRRTLPPTQPGQPPRPNPAVLQAQQNAQVAASVVRRLEAQKAELNAPGQVIALRKDEQALATRKDLLDLQLERLDPSNPRTMERQSIAEEVQSRTAVVEAELATALLRLRYILDR